MYKRAIFQTLKERLSEPRRFIQALVGPRQVGKTTTATEVIQELGAPFHSVSADEPTLHDSVWLAQQWDVARLKLAQQTVSNYAILVIDEIQKIPNWSETVKRLWDEDTKHGVNLKILLLGSAPLLIQKGLTESLMGRFEVIHATHWSYAEMREAFGWTLNQYIYFGGYPGAAPLISDEERWRQYIVESLIEPTISKDILLMTRVDKPALLRQLFRLGCEYSGQIVAYNKMLGQLHDAGNTTTLSHYLHLLFNAGLLTGLNKYSTKTVTQRASSPKLQVLNTALMSVFTQHTFSEAQHDREFWGRLVESATGAHLINLGISEKIDVFYWREHNVEVDFVLQKNKAITGLEVASGRRKDKLHGMDKFSEIFNPKKLLLIGAQGLSLEEFFLLNGKAFF